MVALGELMANRISSLDPSRFPDETFELWSIPAFDDGRPESVTGSEVGSAKKIIEPEDVLLSRIVPHIRRAWVVDAPKSGDRQIGSGEWIIFRSRRFVPAYMRHVLVSDEFHARFMGTVAGVGGSLLRARPEAVKQISIPLPPLPEQRRIAAILDQANAVRRKSYEALARLADLGQAIFSEMFGEIFDSSHSNNVMKLKDFADIQVGFPFKSGVYTGSDDGISLCRGANVLPNRIDWSDRARYPTSLIREHDDYALQVNDIVIAMDRPWISSGFKAARIQHVDLPALLVQRVARIRPRNEYDAYFLYDLVRSKIFQNYCKPTETTVPHISPVEIRNFKFSLPDEGLRIAYSKKMKLIDSIVEVMKTKMKRSDALFLSLQHCAFRGEL